MILRFAQIRLLLVHRVELRERPEQLVPWNGGASREAAGRRVAEKGLGTFWVSGVARSGGRYCGSSWLMSMSAAVVKLRPVAADIGQPTLILPGNSRWMSTEDRCICGASRSDRRSRSRR